MLNPAEIAAEAAVEFFLFALAFGLLFRVWGRMGAMPRRERVPAFHQGVMLRRGQVEKVCEPGSYWVSPGRVMMVVDMRPKPFQIAAQQLLTADGMSVRVSLGGEYQIGDAARFVSENADAFGAFYLEVRQALRSAVGEVPSDTMLSGPTNLTERLRELLIPRGVQLGVEMTQVDVWEMVPVGWVRQG